jgi:hypothetical protein
VGGASDEPVSELRSRRALSRRLTNHAATRTAASSNAAAPAAMPATTGVDNAIRATGASNLQINVQPTIEQSESQLKYIDRETCGEEYKIKYHLADESYEPRNEQGLL